MKILILGNWFYPKNTPRAFRVFELAKEFARLGHQVSVYTFVDGFDYSEMEKKFGFVVHDYGHSFLGLDGNCSNQKKLSIFNRVLRKLFADYNVFPGIEFFPIVKRVLASEKDIDLLLSVAHPHCIHWAVARYIDRNRVKNWIADCGDPYMGDAMNKHCFLKSFVEKYWCKRVDYITIPVEAAIIAYYPEFRPKIRIIPQGFDLSSTSNMPTELTREGPIRFCFAGSVYKGQRDPTAFLEYLSNNNFDAFVFVVFSTSSVFSNYKEVLKDRLVINSYIPREALLKELSQMDFLINITNNSSVQQPSKLIDYAISRRPILQISSHMNAEDIQLFSEFLRKDYSHAYIVPDISRYDVRNVTKLMLELIDNTRV